MIKTGRIEQYKTPCACGKPGAVTTQDGRVYCGNPACEPIVVKDARAVVNAVKDQKDPE